MAECVDEVIETEAPVVKEDIGNTLANHAFHTVQSHGDVAEHKLRHGN